MGMRHHGEVIFPVGEISQRMDSTSKAGVVTFVMFATTEVTGGFSLSPVLRMKSPVSDFGSSILTSITYFSKVSDYMPTDLRKFSVNPIR